MTDQAAFQAQVLSLFERLFGDIRDLRTELKGDISSLKVEMFDLRTELKADIADARADRALIRTEMKAMRDELKADIHEVRDELKADIHETRDELRDMRQELRTQGHKLDEVYQARNKVKITFGFAWAMASLLIAIAASGITQVFG